MNVFPPTYSELVSDALSFGLTGRQVDTLISGIFNSALKSDDPISILNIPLRNLSEFEKFVDSDEVDVTLFDRAVRFVCIFPPKPEHFPVARVYTLTMSSLNEFMKVGVYFENRSIKSVPMSVEDFERKAEIDGYEQRILAYSTKFKEQNSVFSGLVEGRTESTLVERGIIFSSKGCFVCGADAGLVTSTLYDMKEGIIAGFYVCPKHCEEAKKKDTLLNYLTTALGGPPVFGVQDVPIGFAMDATKNFLSSQMSCTIEKVKGNTIIAVRPSGFRIIFRLTSINDYAYMIMNKVNKEVARIDNSDHHNVDYGPDHIHLTPGIDNKNVASSFTYGLPFIDARILNHTLQKHGG